MPTHGESQQFMEEAINSIKDTITLDTWELIIVDDFSPTPFKTNHENVRVVRQPMHLGVGQAFDRGVKEAKSDNIFLQGSDMRFIKNDWDKIMLEEIKNHPKSATCNCCIGLNNESEEGMDINIRRNRSRRFGSTVLIFHDHQSHPKKPSNFRNILECQWLPIPRPVPEESWEIPAVLGAFYGINKQWYEYIGGFELHRSWGSLESYFGIKNWLFGGSCRVSPKCEVGHIFKRQGTHGTPHSHLTYNKLLVATLLFSDKDAKRLIDFLGNNTQVSQAKRMFEQEKKLILAKRDEYRKKIVVDVAEWCKRWNIDFRQ